MVAVVAPQPQVMTLALTEMDHAPPAASLGRVVRVPSAWGGHAEPSEQVEASPAAAAALGRPASPSGSAAAIGRPASTAAAGPAIVQVVPLDSDAGAPESDWPRVRSPGPGVVSAVRIDMPSAQVVGYPTVAAGAAAADAAGSGAAAGGARAGGPRASGLSALGRVVGVPGHRHLAATQLGDDVLATWARSFEPRGEDLADYEAAAVAARLAVLLGHKCFKRKPGVTDAQIQHAAIDAADSAVASGGLRAAYREPVAALLTLLCTAADDTTQAHIRRAARAAFHRARRLFQVRYRQELLAQNPDWQPRTWANSFFCPLSNLTPLDRLDPDTELFDQSYAERGRHDASGIWARSGGARLRLTLYGNLWWTTLGCIPCGPLNLFMPGWGVGLWCCVLLGGNGCCEPTFLQASRKYGCLILSDGGDRLRDENPHAVEKPHFCLPCAGGECCERELLLYRGL